MSREIITLAKRSGQRQFIDVDLPILSEWEPPSGTVTVSCRFVETPWPEPEGE